MNVKCDPSQRPRRRFFSLIKFNPARLCIKKMDPEPPSPTSLNLTLVDSTPETFSKVKTSLFRQRKTWLGTAIDALKVAAAIGSGSPVGIVSAVLDTVVLLLETIERVQRNMQELVEIAESIVSLMQLVLDEAKAKADGESRLEVMCRELNSYLEDILNSVTEQLGKRDVAGWFANYAKSHNIRDVIETYRNKIYNMRADITLAATMDVRGHVVSIDRAVCDVQSAVSNVQHDVSTLKSQLTVLAPATGCLGLSATYSDQFQTILRGDIMLTDTIDTVIVKAETCGSEEADARSVTRVDYRARVLGDVKIVRLYSGGRAHQTWSKDLSMFESLQHPCLLQLNGISYSRQQPGLVFHGDMILLDCFTENLDACEKVEAECRLIDDYDDALQYLIVEMRITHWRRNSCHWRTHHQNPITMNTLTGRLCLVPKSLGRDDVIHSRPKHPTLRHNGLFRAWENRDYTMSWIRFDLPWSSVRPIVPLLPTSREHYSYGEVKNPLSLLNLSAADAALTRHTRSPHASTERLRNYISLLVGLRRPVAHIHWDISSWFQDHRNVPRIGGVYWASRPVCRARMSCGAPYNTPQLVSVTRVELPFVPSEILTVNWMIASSSNAPIAVTHLGSGWTR
ncbi:hypothetical protein C8R43DRAFT_590015 [Mycena crocata]|nr:hypothetical protein C8R43DRAFT_590015 [Mycena crocata]